MGIGVDYIGVSVGALIFNSKGQIFLNKRSQKARNERGCWEVPGGAVHFGETREKAIKREIKEEFGVDIEIVGVLQTSDEILLKDKQHWVATTYIAKIKGRQKPKIMEPEKSDEVGWFSLDKLPSPLSYITQLDLRAYNASKQQFPEPTVGALIANPKGQILLIKSHKWRNKYVVPGGHVELGERMEEALKREVKEETGLDVYDPKPLHIQEFIFDKAFFKKRHFIFHNFAVRTRDLRVKLNEEAQNYIWVYPKEALKLQLEPYTRETVKNYIKLYL